MRYKSNIKVIQLIKSLAIGSIGLLVFIGAAYSLTSHADTITQDVIYLNSSGAKLNSANEALLQGLKGEKVYKCAPQIATVNKTGTAISLKSKKKQLTPEQAKEQIENIKSRVQ